MPSKIKKSSWGGTRPGAGRPRKPDAKAAAFEAAQPSLNRGLIWVPTTDPKRELTAHTRMEILRLSRWLYNNAAQATYIVEHLAQRAIGTGIVVQPKTSNLAWNKKVDQYFEDRNCAEAWAFDAGAQVNFYTAQSLILRQVAIDGDFFAQFLKTKEGAARVRFIGGESIGGSAGYGNPDDMTHDGVSMDRFGAPVSYTINTENGTRIPAEDILHFRHIRRHAQPRGVSWFHSAVSNLRDISEINGFVKGAYKAGAQIGYMVTSTEVAKIGLGAGLKSTTNEVGDLQTSDLPNGILLPRLKPGEKLEAFKNDIPGQTYEAVMRALRSDVAFAVGLPPEAMMVNVGLAGTEQRAVLEVTQNFLERLQQQVIDQFCRPFYKYWLWHEMQAGRLEYPGDDWWRHEWLAPKKITVDSGRDARAFSEQLDKGHLSPTRFYNMQGLRAEEEEADVIETYLRRKQKCEALGLDVAQVFPNSLRSGLAAQQPAESSDDDADSAEPSEGSAELDMQAKEKLDAVGAAVRAGVITPSAEVEKSIRSMLALPEMGEAVISEWQDNPTRSPITLTNSLAAPDAPAQPAPEDPQQP
ncbi:MAG: phage portal protein [Verrucomicrobia bacterium]|nr:phage portal protein [Verrucomicrobiota bacterium]